MTEFERWWERFTRNQARAYSKALAEDGWRAALNRLAERLEEAAALKRGERLYSMEEAYANAAKLARKMAGEEI